MKALDHISKKKTEPFFWFTKIKYILEKYLCSGSAKIKMPSLFNRGRNINARVFLQLFIIKSYRLTPDEKLFRWRNKIQFWFHDQGRETKGDHENGNHVGTWNLECKQKNIQDQEKQKECESREENIFHCHRHWMISILFNSNQNILINIYKESTSSMN